MENLPQSVVQDAITHRVACCSRNARTASPVLTYLVMQLFGRAPVAGMPGVNIPLEFLVQIFIRKLILGTEDAKRPDRRIRDSYRFTYQNTSTFRRVISATEIWYTVQVPRSINPISRIKTTCESM